MPRVGSRQVLIEIDHAGLNLADVLMAQGKYQAQPELPATLGIELAGTVLASTGDRRTGERVMALVPSGGFARFAAVDASSLFDIPSGMTGSQAASQFMLFPCAVYTLLERGRLVDQDILVVRSASGGLGQALIKVAIAAGAGRIIGIVGDDAKVGVVRAAGESRPDFEDHLDGTLRDCPPTFFVDTVGGSHFAAVIRRMAPGGRVALLGFASGHIPEIRANLVMLKNLVVYGIHWPPLLISDRELVVRANLRIRSWVESGVIDIGPAEVVDLEQVPAALRRLASRQTVGKIVAAIS
jgi:NADPH2:quinone reductase